jgi:hypothetical protein
MHLWPKHILYQPKIASAKKQINNAVGNVRAKKTGTIFQDFPQFITIRGIIFGDFVETVLTVTIIIDKIVINLTARA